MPDDTVSIESGLPSYVDDPELLEFVRKNPEWGDAPSDTILSAFQEWKKSQDKKREYFLPPYIYEEEREGKNKDGTKKTVKVCHLDYMQFSDHLKGKFRIHNFKKILFIFDHERGIFKHHTNEVETAIRDVIKEYHIQERLTTAVRETVLHIKSMGCVDNYPFIGTFGTIHLANGSMNLDTGEIRKAKPEDLYDYRIETPYKQFPNGTPELDSFLGQYGTREPIDILAKCIWQRAYHDTLKELTVFVGPKDAGKTTLNEFVQVTLDGCLSSRANVSRTLLHELLQRFGYADLEGRLLNYGDDLPDMFIKNSGRINTLVGSVNQHIERKGIDGYDAVLTVYHVFSANNLPPLDDDDAAIWGKIHLIECDKVITSDRIPKDRLFTQLLREQLLFRAIELVKGWGKTPYRNNQDADWVREKWHESSTDVDEFLRVAMLYDPTTTGLSLEEVKKHYEEWCQLNGRKRHMKFLTKKIQPALSRRCSGNVYLYSKLALRDPEKTKPSVLTI